MGDNNKNSYPSLSKLESAYKKLVQQGFTGGYVDFRNGYLNRIDDILSGKFQYVSPQKRVQLEIKKAGGYQQYLKQERQRALELFRKQEAEIQEYKNNPQEYIKKHSGLGVEKVNVPTIEQARQAYNNTIRYLNTLNPDGAIKRSGTQHKNVVSNISNLNNNFNVRAFQNWVLQRNKFWKLKGYNDKVYSLGKFGVDGIMGKYTRTAYNALKNEYNRYLKSGMKNYSNFYNKYIYKDPSDLLERMNDSYEILNANSQVNDLFDTTIPKVELNPVEPYTHDEYVNNKLNIMRQYKTTPTPQENNHNVLENDMIGLKNTTIFKFGGLIPKYQYGGNYSSIKDSENYWNNYLANTGYKAKYTEENPLLGLLWPFGTPKNTYEDYRKQYINVFYNKLEKDFNNQVPRSTLIQNPLISKAFERNFNIWWKNQNFGAMIPETSADRIYKGDGSIEGKDLNSTVKYRPGYIYDNGWIKINTNDKTQKSTQGINFSRFQFKKLGGIIKASGGWRVGDSSKGEKEDQIYGTVKGQKVTFDVKDGEPIYWTWTTDNNGTHYTAHKFLMTDQDIAELNAIAKSVGRTSFFKNTNIKSKPYYYFNAQRTPARQAVINQPTNANQPVKQTAPSNQNFDLSENNPLVQEFLNKNGYVKSTPTDVSKNGNISETVKPESETIKPEEQKQVTYSDILSQNTDIIKNKIFNSGWRGAFKDSLNRALMTPDYYNNGDGTQVYDFELPDGTIINYDYLSGNGLLNKHGLLKAGAMRKLAKNFRQQGRNIAQQRYVGIGNQQISPNATPSIVNASIVNGGQPIVPVVNGQVATEINSFGLDKATGYPSMVNNFNGTSYIDPNAAYRAEQEKQNAINLQNRS